MAYASPLSVGDIIALIKLLKSIGKGLKDHGGAAEDFQHIVRELEQSANVFDVIHSIPLPDDYSQQKERILGVADGLHQTTAKLYTKLSKCEVKLGHNAPGGFYHGTIQKAKWVAYVSKKIPKYRESIVAQCHSLQCLLSELLVTITSSSAVQARATHALVEKAITAQISYQRQTDRSLGRLRSSLRTIERQSHFVCELDKKSSLKNNENRHCKARILVLTHESLPSIATPINNLLYAANVSSIKLESYHQDAKEEIIGSAIATKEISDANQDISQFRFEQTSRRPDSLMLANGASNTAIISHASALPSSKPSSAHDAMSLLLPMGSSFSRAHPRMENQISRKEDLGLNLANFTDVQLHALYLLIQKCMEHLQPLVQLNLQVLLVLWSILQTVPVSMTCLLSDNIIVLDALDRRHSLQFEYFRDSTVFRAMLVSRFENCPGFEKIIRGQFTIVDSRVPDQTIALENWSQMIRPRARLAMIIHYSALKISDQHCARCSKLMLEVKPCFWVCSACGITFRIPQPYYSAGYETDTASLKVSSRSSGFLLVPTDAETLANNDLNHYQRQMSNFAARDGQSTKSFQPLQVTTPELLKDINNASDASAEDHMEAIMTDYLDESKSARTDIPDLAKDEPQILQDDSLQQRRLEVEELQHFKRVRINGDTSLYEATLNGNHKTMYRFLKSTIDPDGVCGPWGSLLTAAIISDSPDMVRQMLLKGSNPLLEKGPLGTPLRASALRGHIQILSDLISAAKLKALSPESLNLEAALASALLAATRHNQVSSVQILLLHNANPFFGFRANFSEPSAFVIAVFLKLRNIVESFLLDAAYRGLLSWPEYCFASSNRFGDISDVDREYLLCCEEMYHGRGRMIQQRILSRLATIGGYKATEEPALCDGESVLLYAHRCQNGRSDTSSSFVKDSDIRITLTPPTGSTLIVF